jgi:hypothetical protein
MSTERSAATDNHAEVRTDPLIAAFASLQPGMDASRPTLESLLRNSAQQTASSRSWPWPLWLPLSAAALLLVALTFRSYRADSLHDLPEFASTLQWSAPSDLFGPALPGSSSDWLTPTGSDWATQFSMEGASR